MHVYACTQRLMYHTPKMLYNQNNQTHIHCTCLKLIEAETNGRQFADDILKCIFLNVWIPIKISLKFVPKGPINNIPAMVQIMAWRRPGDKPLSEPMMVSLPTHICVARPQWVKRSHEGKHVVEAVSVTFVFTKMDNYGLWGWQCPLRPALQPSIWMWYENV